MTFGLEADSLAGHERFVSQVLESELVWGLRSEAGWANCPSNSTPGSSVMPFWSQRAGALRCACEGWDHYHPESIPLFESVWGIPLVRQTLDELEAWLVHPIPWNKVVLLRTLESLPPPARSWDEPCGPAAVLGRVASWIESGVHEQSRFLLLPLNEAPRSLRATIREELIPWILGYGDPLRVGES